MRKYVITVVRFLTATDERTWIGHGIQGFLFGFVPSYLGTPAAGILFTTGAFAHREVSEALDEWFKDGTADFTPEHIRDHILDFVVPLVASGFGALAAQIVRAL